MALSRLVALSRHASSSAFMDKSLALTNYPTGFRHDAPSLRNIGLEPLICLMNAGNVLVGCIGYFYRRRRQCAQRERLRQPGIIVGSACFLAFRVPADEQH